MLRPGVKVVKFSPETLSMFKQDKCHLLKGVSPGLNRFSRVGGGSVSAGRDGGGGGVEAKKTSKSRKMLS